MPYISASIIFQLMTAVVPALSRLQQEGDVGRQKLTQYTRYATVLICLIQGTLLLLALKNPGQLFPATMSRLRPDRDREQVELHLHVGDLHDGGHDAADVAR
jgi:preprotein translocase subunit SecY